MNNKLSKKLRKLSIALAQVGENYLVKTETKVFTDFNGNKFPYTTDQTVLHPKCAKSILSFLKKLKTIPQVTNFKQLTALVHSEGEAKLNELKIKGYSLV